MIGAILLAIFIVWATKRMFPALHPAARVLVGALLGAVVEAALVGLSSPLNPARGAETGFVLGFIIIAPIILLKELWDWRMK